MRRRELVKALLGLAAAPMLLPLGTPAARAQPAPPDDAPAEPPGQPAELPAPPAELPAQPLPQPVAPLPTTFARGPIPNNIVGLNVARLHQPIYIWATSDVVNANGGDWGYITVVWTVADREDRNAEYNFQQFLDRCFEHHVQPIVRVATTFSRSTKPGNSPPGSKGMDGSWSRPDWDEPRKWRAFFERATWPSRHAWIIVGNEPNLGREWGDEVDAAGYARYLAHFLDVFQDTPRFDVVSGALDISNSTQLPVMQDALEFLDEMAAAVPSIFERLPAWASNPYRVISGGPGARYTHLAYEAEFDRIGREMPVLITEAGHLETGDEMEIARFYAEAFRDWMADPKVVAATPLFWHPDRNEFWMFELDSKNRFVYKSPTYELLRKLPRMAGSPEYVATMGNVARTTPFEEPGTAAAPEDDGGQPASAHASEREGDTWELDADGQPAAPHPAARAQPPAAQANAAQSAQATTPAAGPAQASAGTSPSGGAPAAARPSVAQALRVANTDGAGARLRLAPSVASDALTVLPDGSMVEALGPEQGSGEQRWRRVRAEDGVEGWIAAELLEPADE
ncbi:MAG: SH3 domain-containing protein [Chloroflexi bacterium]|nr:SH3 domain-containing protein [Chloroflexota bacterium]